MKQRVGKLDVWPNIRFSSPAAGELVTATGDGILLYSRSHFQMRTVLGRVLCCLSHGCMG